MPSLLKKGTRQRIEASQTALFEGLSIAQRPYRGSSNSLCDEAIAIGLIGTAAELAISACLFEVLGQNGILRKSGGHYLTAAEALDKFKRLLSASVPGITPLVAGISKKKQHLGKLHNAAACLSVLFNARASGLHAGEGVSPDVLFHTSSQVIKFMKLLSQSSKWTPYLQNIPETSTSPKDGKLLVDELANLLYTSENPKDAAKTIKSIFLILPEITRDKPEWIDALQRVQVSPKAEDISVLVSALKSAKVGDLSKVSKGSEALPVKIVGRDDPTALSVAMGNFKKEYTCIYDQWRGEMASSNASLEKGILDTPHIHFTYTLSAVGLSSVGIPENEFSNGLPAHDIWAFIATALLYQGTVGPCFFLARKLKHTESGQLRALLLKAGKLNKKIEARLNDYWPLLQATAKETEIRSTSTLLSGLRQSVNVRSKKAEQLEVRLKEVQQKLPKEQSDFCDLIFDLYPIEDGTGPLLNCISTSQEKLKTYTTRLLRPVCEASKDRDDLTHLIKLLNDKTLGQIHTEARKAIRDIDFAYYGPKS